MHKRGIVHKKEGIQEHAYQEMEKYLHPIFKRIQSELKAYYYFFLPFDVLEEVFVLGFLTRLPHTFTAV